MTRAVSIPLRPICLIEAVTYLVLVAAVVWHRLGGGPDWVSVLGPVHGVVFLVYLAAVLRTRRSLGWDAQATVTALFAAAIPFGAFVVAHRLTADPALPFAVGLARPVPSRADASRQRSRTCTGGHHPPPRGPAAGTDAQPPGGPAPRTPR